MTPVAVGAAVLLLLAQSCMAGGMKARKILQDPYLSPSGGPQCPQGSSPCSIPPCSVWPCLAGWTAENDVCGCRCKCTPPLGAPDLSTDISAAATPETPTEAARSAEEQQLMVPVLPGQQEAANGTCAQLYQPCTCSAQCCEGLVCGFPLRGPLTRQQQDAATAAVAAAMAAAANQSAAAVMLNRSALNSSALQPLAFRNGSFDSLNGSTAANASSNSTSNNNGTAFAVAVGNNSSNITAAIFVDTGGPSCRPLELLDPRTAVVNYGC